jgi:hypothetical protein
MADEDRAILHGILWITGNPPTLAPAAQSLKHLSQDFEVDNEPEFDFVEINVHKCSSQLPIKQRVSVGLIGARETAIRIPRVAKLAA